MRVIFHPEAEDELAEAVSFYAARAIELGIDLRTEVNAALDSICDSPDLCEFVEGDVRRRRVRRFRTTSTSGLRATNCESSL